MKTAKQLKLTKTQHKNLAKLTVFVRDKVAPPKFNIKWFFTEKRQFIGDCASDTCPMQEEYSCGTSACFLGYAILAGIKAQKHELWRDYCKRAFGVEMGDRFDCYNFLFSHEHKNNKAAAVKRGAYFLENGLPELVNLATWEAPRSFKPDWASIEFLANS